MEKEWRKIQAHLLTQLETHGNTENIEFEWIAGVDMRYKCCFI